MTGEGDLKGIETNSSGHLFRSRLEARWAEMFTAVGWKWIYEPFDANGYIPDFILQGPRPVLVEVKPATTKQEYEQHTERLEQALNGVWEHDILIVGYGVTSPIGDKGWSNPTIGLLGEPCSIDGAPEIGWGPGAWAICPECEQIAVAHAWNSYVHRPCGHYDGNIGSSPKNLEELFGEAHKRTRWTPPGRTS